MVADLNRVQVKVAAEENQVNWLVVGGMERRGGNCGQFYILLASFWFQKGLELFAKLELLEV